MPTRLITGVRWIVSHNGRGISIRWPTANYQPHLPSYQVIEWETSEDIRLKSEIVISCRVPDITSIAQPPRAELRLPRHLDAENRQETEEAVKAMLSVKREHGLAGVLALALATAVQGERTPVGVGGGGAEFSSLLVRYPASPSRASVVEPLESDGLISMLVSGIELDMTVDGWEVRAALRFKPDVGPARAGRVIVQHCVERQWDPHGINCALSQLPKRSRPLRVGLSGVSKWFSRPRCYTGVPDLGIRAYRRPMAVIGVFLGRKSQDRPPKQIDLHGPALWSPAFRAEQ